jgi:hypothetical protein
MIRRLMFAGLVATVAAVPTHAQGFGGGYEEVRLVQFGIGGGAIIPRTNARFQDVLTGATGQAFLLIRIAPGLPSIRLGADFSRMKFGDPTQTVAGTLAGSTRTQVGGIASLRFDLLHGRVRPYLLGGVGAFSIRDAVTVSGSFINTNLSTTEVGIDGGGGISFSLGRLRGFVESRVQNIYTKDEGLINTKAIQAIPITFGLIF